MRKTITTAALAVALMPLPNGSPATSAFPRTPASPAAGRSATETFPDLEAQYRKQLESARREIERKLPKIRDSRRESYLDARAAEAAARAEVEAATKRMGELGSARGLVGHAKGKWIGGAEKEIAKARARLDAANSAAERKAAEDDLARWEQNREEGRKALEGRQAALDRAELERPAIEERMERARAAAETASERTSKAAVRLGLDDLLERDRLDGELARFVALHEATPAGLAAFAGKGRGERALIEGMLDDEELLVRMAVADGPRDGNYGRAMQILRDIREASALADEGCLGRLALAIALEHAAPVKQRNAVGAVEAPPHVDPVARYLHFEQALRAGELDPAFPGLTVWEYRMVVDGEEPDEVLAWGREMLRNYRPDHVTTGDERWRYVGIVGSEIRYGSQDNHFDRDDLQFFQNILMNGGICGRRAFFGRFILRAFGVPTTARPQKGHAALVHRTNDGWVPCLGAGWGSGWTKTRYRSDVEFLVTTQARATGEAFLRVKRAQWIGDGFGEPRVFGRGAGEPGFWYGLALDVQRDLVAEATSLDAVGSDIAEADGPAMKVAPGPLAGASPSKEERRPTVAADGTITLPAAGTSRPTRGNRKIVFMPSVLGGEQLHYSRGGDAQDFEYAFDAPAAGTYALSARVVTPSWRQFLVFEANGSGQVAELPLPHTVGAWEQTEPVEIELVEGRNVLRVSHRAEGYAKGFSVRDFTLRPVR